MMIKIVNATANDNLLRRSQRSPLRRSESDSQRCRSNRYAFVALMVVMLLLTTSRGLCEERSADVYLDAVQRFAECVLKNGLDRYGRQETPLFVDGLHITTLEPAVWKKDGETWILCNFASQQPLMRLLDGLTTMTGEARYRKMAEDATRFTMQNLQTPNGLLHWGGHMAWDLTQERPVGQYHLVHELKGHQPYYALMFRVAPDATRRLQETIWATHILDWSLLDYNRHAGGAKDKHPQWDHAFNEDSDVPFPAQGGNLSFVNVTPPLLHSAVMLAIQNDHDRALLWSQRLVERWQQARHPDTGLSGGQLSFRDHDRAQDALGHVHPTINEAKVVASYHQTSRYHALPLAQMQAGEELLAKQGVFAKAGRDFIAGAAEDLEIYARECFDNATGQFNAMTTDGERLQWREAKTDYYTPSSFQPRPADSFLFWGYCTAFRLTGDPAHWTMARRLAEQFGLGDLGASPEGTREIAMNTNTDDWRIVYALLELHEATDDDMIVELAACVGDNVMGRQHASGLFPRSNRQYARTGDDAPLALLHLAAAIAGRRSELPKAKSDRRFFHAEFDGPLEAHQQKRADARTYDNNVYYGAQ
jgi:pectate lyase